MSVPFLPIPEDPLEDENFGSFRDPDGDLRLRQFQELASRGWATAAIGAIVRLRSRQSRNSGKEAPRIEGCPSTR